MKWITNIILIGLFAIISSNAHAAVWTPYPGGNFDLSVDGIPGEQVENVNPLFITNEIIGAHTNLIFTSFTPVSDPEGSWIEGQVEMEIGFTNGYGAAIEISGNSSIIGTVSVEYYTTHDEVIELDLGEFNFGQAYSYGIALLEDRVAYYQNFIEFHSVSYATLGYVPVIDEIVIEGWGSDGSLIGSAADTYLATMDPVPIPGAVLLLGSGLLGLAGFKRKIKD